MLLALRSLLFVPAHDPIRLTSAFTSAADAVVVDLEDAVPLDRKTQARRLLKETLPAYSSAARLVRVNGANSGELPADLEAVAALPLDGLVLPKATAASVAILESSGLPIVAMVETARGLNEAAEIASSPRVEALVLGGFDLSADLRLETLPNALELLYARSKLVVDSVAAEIRRPVDRVFQSSDDPSALQADAQFARSLGFGGKACTDARQIKIINSVFADGSHTEPARGD